MAAQLSWRVAARSVMAEPFRHWPGGQKRSGSHHPNNSNSPRRARIPRANPQPGFLQERFCRLGNSQSLSHYKLAAMLANVVLNLVPTSVTAVMMTTATNDAIKPYSIAVTPFSFVIWNIVARIRANRFMVFSYLDE
jgi:hypothetical protein